MSRLFLVHDLSPSQPWIHSILLENRRFFAEKGLEVGPFNPWTCEILPSHGPLWLPQPDDKPIDPVIKSMILGTAAIMRSGKDVLLFAHNPMLAAHQSFLHLLQGETDIDCSSVSVLFIIGKPMLALEQRYREYGRMQDREGFKYVDAYANMAKLLEHAKNAYGNVECLANIQDTAQVIPQQGLAAGLFTFLGRNGQAPGKIRNCHPLNFDSNAGRRLCGLAEVRKNSWPHMDEGEYVKTLLRLDSTWGCDIASPAAMRAKLHYGFTTEISSLENDLGLQRNALAAPQWLLEASDSSDPECLDVKKIADFATNLPENLRASLLKRYKNDAQLLTKDQKSLYAALKETAGIDHVGEPETPVELTVLTMTYNHGEYIKDCLESVLAQRTNFPIRHIVLDHCSTDGTAEIVRSFAEKHSSIRPVLLSRRQPEENVRGLFERCRTRYAALCDGDDFFTDRLKLQKQVDFLEKNQNCSICFHPVLLVFENGATPFLFPPADLLPQHKSPFYYLTDLTTGNFIQTNSAVYRWRFTNGLPHWFRADVCPGDWYWHMLHAEKGRIGFLPETMAIYRRHEKALYAHTFLDTDRHWRTHGMTELNAFNIYNEHFKNRYFRNFSSLANGIFASFLNMAIEEKDDSLLEQATMAFPQFAREFFRFIKTAQDA